MPPTTAGTSMKSLIFFATYNEAGNVAGLIDSLLRHAPGADILVVDDNSPDGTADVLRGLGRENVKVLVRKGKLGLGTAHMLAFTYAMAHDYDVLITMDADGSHDPLHLRSLMAVVPAGNDFGIGSRYMDGGACDYDGYRLRVSQAANTAARFLLGIRLSEFTTSYRAFRVERLRGLNYQSLLVGGYSFFLTTVVEGARRGWKMSELPIHFRERGYGTSKIPPFEIFRGMANLLRLATIKLLHGKPRETRFEPQSCDECSVSYSLIATRTGSHCVFCGTVA